MILRYFYIQKYNDITENININLGGKYKFAFDEQKKRLNAVLDDTYISNLYKKFDVISDISALLGKNGSGKTTVLRIINQIFNRFYNRNDTGYIIVYEGDNQKYYMNTNIKKVLELKDSLTDMCEYRNISDMLDGIGLIYYSGIFDKATPFQGNANLIDISTNFDFENFYKENKSTLPESILDEYRLKCLMQELSFLISLNTEFKNEIEMKNFTPLFKTPNQIEISFWWDGTQIQEVDPKSTIAYSIEILKQLAEQVLEYFGVEKDENEINEDGGKKKFLQETLFYLLMDELHQQILDEMYDVESALNYLKFKLSENQWDIDAYFDSVLDKLFLKDNDVEGWASKENDEMENVVNIYTFSDIVQELEDLQEKLLSFDFPDWEETKNHIDIYIIFFQNKVFEQKGEVISNLINIYKMIEELQNDLQYSDYDLFSDQMIINLCDELEVVRRSISTVFGDFISISYNDFGEDEDLFKDENIAIEDLENDREIDERIELLKGIKNKICFLVEKNHFNVEERFLQLKLDDESILDFIKVFMELEYKLVKIDIKRNDISSGHSSYIDMCSRLNAARKSGEIARKEYVILLIDEGDIYLHPEMQLKFINNLLKLLQMMFRGKKVQLILTSNSPFIVSDIQKSNIVYLEKRSEDNGENNFIDSYNKSKILAVHSRIYNTFAANVNDLLRNSFFVKDSLFGEYSIEVINEIIKSIRDDKHDIDVEYVESIIGIIGEPLIKKKLENMFFDLQLASPVSREIEYYKRQIKALEKIEKKGKTDGKC